MQAQPGPDAAASALGEPIALALPLDCRIGHSCWVANYADADPSSRAADFRCGPRSYDGHDGVDIALRDLGVMAAGVEVRAAAAGTVRNARDGMADIAVTDAPARARIAGRECGNGVLLDHPGGWQTQYCHLRQGSVRVQPGQPVAAGAPLALVGLSGLTEFPHLHLAVRADGKKIDPFSGQALDAGCGLAAVPLWRADAGIAYEEAALYDAGFAPGPPDIEAIRRGERPADMLAADAPALVLWVDMFGVRAGDSLRLGIRDPAGAVIHATEQAIERTQARRFAFSGLRRRLALWPAGHYTGTIALLRPGGSGDPVAQRTLGIELR